MKLDQLDLTGYTSFLLKGSNGFGKTVAAASFARLGPVHISYWDKKGPIELIHMLKKLAPNLLKNIEYDVYGAHNANEYLNKYIGFIKDCRYTALITDSVTSMTGGAVNWSLGFRDNKNKNKDKIIPDFDEYKVETSLVTQALDICTTLPAHIIWIAHPLPQIKIEDSGAGKVGRITKANSIVTYGSKVAGIVPGRFSEIYHFSKQSDWDEKAGRSRIKYIVSTEQVGDEYAKSNIGLKSEMDITDKLFYDVWKEEVRKFQEALNEVKEEESKPNPFASINSENKPNTPKDPTKPWLT